MSLQDFLGCTSDIVIIDFLAENLDEEYSVMEISEYTGLSKEIVQEKLPELILNKIIEISEENTEIKKFRMKDNDIVNFLIRAALAHSFTMAEEDRSEQEIYEEICESIKSEIEKPKVYKEKLQLPGVERYTLKEAIDKVKNNAKTNVLLIDHMANITIEQKLYLAYFYGTRENKPTILDLQDKGELSYELNKNDLYKKDND